MKRKCNNCEHKCHCIGQGYNVSETFCDICDCMFCQHEVNQPTEENMNWIKKQW